MDQTQKPAAGSRYCANARVIKSARPASGRQKLAHRLAYAGFAVLAAADGARREQILPAASKPGRLAPPNAPSAPGASA